MNDEIPTDGSAHSSNDGAQGTGGSQKSVADDAIKLRTKMYFGIGAGGEAASMWVFNALGLIFYQQILGLPAGLAATAMALAIIADAITDPLTVSYTHLRAHET